jgi:hypothetical protein
MLDDDERARPASSRRETTVRRARRPHGRRRNDQPSSRPRPAAVVLRGRTRGRNTVTRPICGPRGFSRRAARHRRLHSRPRNDRRRLHRRWSRRSSDRARRLASQRSEIGDRPHRGQTSRRRCSGMGVTPSASAAPRIATAPATADAPATPIRPSREGNRGLQLTGSQKLGFASEPVWGCGVPKP